MGPILSSPHDKKTTIVVANDNFHVAATKMQGWRDTMEDAHCIHLTLPNRKDCGLFGVFDGHGGKIVADKAAQLVAHRLSCHPAYGTNTEEALSQTFLDIDQMISTSMCPGSPGSTAVVCHIDTQNKVVICANIGDSRAIACTKGLAKVLSHDHKPDNASEKERIEAAGGYVAFHRVMGNLAMSRAFGDYEFKQRTDLPPSKQMVIALPEIISHKLTPDDEFIFLACDGIWDVLSRQETVDFIRPKLSAGYEPGNILEQLLDQCIARDCNFTRGLGCDNMTAILVCLLNGNSWSEYVQKIKTSFHLTS